MNAPLVLPLAMSEADWTAWVVVAASGFSSGLMTADCGVFIDQSNAGNLRPEQKEWLRHLGPHGCLWRPRDAETVLARLSRGNSAWTG